MRPATRFASIRSAPVRSGGRSPEPSLRACLLVGVACAAGAKLGLLLAAPSIHLTDVRPSAGIALASILLLGPRVWSWILLGTAIAHVGVGFTELETATIGASIGLPLVVGIGEVLQALAAAALVRRCASIPTALGEASEVLSLMTIAGPVGAAIGSTISTAGLLLLGEVRLTAAAPTFGAWWIGSAIGGAVFAPVAILWSTGRIRSGLRRKLSVTIPLGVILAFALVLFAQVDAREEERIATEFDRRVDELANGVERGFDASLEVLDSLGSFYDASRSVDRREFSAFARYALEQGRGVRSLAWCPRVQHRERASCVRAGRLEIDPAYAIQERSAAGALVPAAERPEYVPVFYVETLSRTKGSRGLDAAADPVRRAALDRARDGGVSAATPPLALGDGAEDGHRGTIVYRPVFGHGEKHETEAERKRSLVGYVSAEIRIQDIVETALGSAELDALRFELRDVTEAGNESLLAARGSGEPAGGRVVRYRFAGRDWQMRFDRELSAGVPHRSWQAWFVLAAGLLFTGLLEAFLLVGTGRSETIEALVARRTRELEEANSHLRHEVLERARAESEHESSEIRLAAAQALAHLGSWELDLERRSVLWSDELHRIHGFAPGRGPLALEACLERIHPEDRQRLARFLEVAVRDRKPFAIHVRIVRPDEQVRTLHVRGEVVCDASGSPVRVHGTGQDVTELRHAERELARRTLELERSNAELERFAYVASHDLQEPLRAVASHVQILEQDYKGRLDADADISIRCAVEGARRMHALINDYLAYSRVRVASEALEPTPVGRALELALRNLEAAVAEARAIVTFDAMPTVLGDPTQVTQLFQNLVGNAVKFRGEERPRVHVAAARAETFWLFSVSDNGIGIDPEHTRRIFTLFRRLHTQDRYPGTGIGLAICKKIVDRHGGRIWVESMPGMGSTFHFTLPCCPEPALPSPPPGSAAPSTTMGPEREGGRA